MLIQVFLTSELTNMSSIFENNQIYYKYYVTGIYSSFIKPIQDATD